jgi:hypothetical protein
VGDHLKARPARDVEATEVGLGHRSDHLPHAVGPIVEADHHVAIAHWRDGRPVLVLQDTWRDELVSLAARVRVPNDRQRVRCRRARSLHRDVVPLLGPIPPLVAIHAEVPPADRRDPRPSSRIVQQFAHEPEPRRRHRVATVHKSVDNGAIHPFALCHVDQREQVRIDGMDPSLSNEPH